MPREKLQPERIWLISAKTVSLQTRSAAMGTASFLLLGFAEIHSYRGRRYFGNGLPSSPPKRPRALRPKVDPEGDLHLFVLDE